MATPIFDALTYDTVKQQNVLVTEFEPTYQNVATLSTPSREAGQYETGFSLTYVSTDAASDVFFRFRINGGGWNVFQVETVSITDEIPWYYAYPSGLAAGVNTIEFEMAKQTGHTGTLTALFVDVFLKRVG